MKTPLEHRGTPGEFTQDCNCAACEKHRVMHGQAMLNPRGAVDGPTEQRPRTSPVDVR